MKKTVIINRAVPGSGKTTISNCLMKFLREEKNIDVNIHSTDNFFLTPEGTYNFDVEKLNLYHFNNLQNFLSSLEKNIPIVICDNINLSPWQTEPYTQAARKYGYRILFITFEPRNLEAHIASQMVTDEKPDAHRVPKSVLVRFIKEYKTYTPLLYKANVIIPKIHKGYMWDTKNCCRISTAEPSKYFDLDYIIYITPDKYHFMKDKIGEIVFKFL